jgi:hypothetical protein
MPKKPKEKVQKICEECGEPFQTKLPSRARMSGMVTTKARKFSLEEDV